MIEQVRRAVTWIYKNAASFGGDAERIFITGHSSGAHLAGVTLVTDWVNDHGLPPDVIKGGLLVSGMYDLKPVRLSKRSEYVKFTDEIEEKLSSQRHLDKLNAPVIIAYGTQETPEFQRQSREFAAAVKAAGKPVELIVGEGFNHFEMQETFANPYGIAGRAALKMMQLKVGEFSANALRRKTTTARRLRSESRLNWVQIVQAVQNVLNDWNFLNGLNGSLYLPKASACLRCCSSRIDAPKVVSKNFSRTNWSTRLLSIIFDKSPPFSSWPCRSTTASTEPLSA